MTKNCAIQYIPEKIRVNAVAPTAIDNDLLKVKRVLKPDRANNNKCFFKFYFKISIQGFLNSAPDPEAAKKNVNRLNPWGAYHNEILQVPKKGTLRIPEKS